jgi:hypothetical protein
VHNEIMAGIRISRRCEVAKDLVRRKVGLGDEVQGPSGAVY